jgi:hypothetical protein
MAEKDEIADAREQFAAAQEAWGSLMDQALEDIKFARLGEQWPDDVLKKRQKEGRPALTINRLPGFIRQVVNDARQSRPAIKVRPVDDRADIETADIIGGLIRHIEYASDAQVAYDTALECAVTSGFGFFRVNVGYPGTQSWESELRIERIANPLSVYWDPYSMAADSSDWGFCFVTEMLDTEEFKSRFPGAAVTDWEGEKDANWVTKDQTRIAEWWTREKTQTVLVRLSDGTVLDAAAYKENQELFQVAGLEVVGERKGDTWKVLQRLVSGSEVLERTEWRGRYIPVVPVYGDEVVVEGKRHFLSLIRPAMDAQRMYNYWRTTSTELVALAPKAPWVGPRGAFNIDAEKWASANTEAHAYIEYEGPVPPQRVPFDGVPAGALQEALSASDDLKAIMGMYDASLGARSNETSGKAILARQREGDVGTFHFMDNLGRALRHAGRILVDMIPQVYTGPRIIRVLGLDGQADAVQANEAFIQGGVTKLYDLQTGSYDVTVEIGPSYTTRRQEAAEQMTAMIQAYPDIAPIIGDILAKSLDWPEADEIAKRLKAMLPPQIQQLESEDGMPPEAQAALAGANQQIEQMQQIIQQGQQMLAELQQKLQAAEMEAKNKQADALAKVREAELRHDAELAKAQAEIEKARVEAEAEGDVARIEAMTQMITERLNVAVEQMKASIAEVKAAVPQAAPEREEREESRPRTVTIQAPSGGVYTGTIQ